MDKRNVEKHAGGDGEYPSADLGIGRYRDANKETDNARARRDQVENERLPMRETALDQHAKVAQLVRNLVAHDGYCRADAHADRLRETRAHSHAVLRTVKKRIRENAHSK